QLRLHQPRAQRTTIGLIISSGWFRLTNYQAKAHGGHKSEAWAGTTLLPIYDEGTYGERGFQEFKSHASQQGICIKQYLVIPRNARNDSLAASLTACLKLEKSRVVVAFCQAETCGSYLASWGARLTKRQLLLGAEQIGLHSRYEQEGLVPMVVDAVYAMAHSLENILHRLCPSKLNGTVLRDHIRNVSFIGTSGNILRFNRKGDRESLYEIFQFPASPSWKKRFIRVRVRQNWHLGRRPSGTGQQQPSLGHPRRSCTQISSARSLCGFGYRTVAPNKEAATCCWECVPCDNKYQIVLNATLCSNCELGSVPNRFFNDRYLWRQSSWAAYWALLPMTFSFLGLVWTVFVLVVFVRYNNTPIIRASGRELCYVMLAGVSMSYCMTFIMLAPPTPRHLRLPFAIFNGLSLSIIYSAIFTKTNRLSRIFNRGIKSLMKKPSYTSPKSQLILCCCLVSVAEITKVLRCAVDDVAIVVSLLYNMILIVLCTLYAFKTRNIPENFNEAKYIAFTMYSTCIVWLAFIAIYFGSLRNFRWSSESQRSGRQHRYGGSRQGGASERLALPADGGVASDSDSDSGAAAATSKARIFGRDFSPLANGDLSPLGGGEFSQSNIFSSVANPSNASELMVCSRETSTAVESDLLFSRVTWFIDEEATFAMPAAYSSGAAD
uniref:G_PROTEIN_RECEP_F3_4 domain-containing protein n=1 Tax=Macrostomum lignano TaxID=282301 RepID=A0A1I8JPE8_9PLAT